jgi:hypothetical protein
VLRRIISAVALLAFASTPVVARTRLFCRYTGVEITDCAEQDIPGSPVVQGEGCCNRQVSRTLDSVLGGQQQEIAPPVLQTVSAVSFIDPSDLAPDVRRKQSAAVPTGPPLFLIARALLI